MLLNRIVCCVAVAMVFMVSYAWAEDPYPIDGVRLLGSSMREDCYGIATDAAGNAFITGWTTGSLDGANQGSYDMFLAKYGADGNWQWTEQLGTSLNDGCYSVAVDSAGNALITGYTEGLLGETSYGNKDAFLAKYDSSGTQVWTRQFGTSSWEFGQSVSVDSADNVYIAGNTYGEMPENRSQGATDAFLAKFDTNGDPVWVRQFGTDRVDEARGVTVDSADNVYIVGNTYGALPGYTNQGWTDTYLAKYDASGNQLWVRQFGTSSYEQGQSVAVDADGNAFIGGSTWGYLGTDPGGSHSGAFDAFLTKYDTDGDLQWTQQLGTGEFEEGTSVAVDAAGNAFLTGYTGGYLGTGEGSNLGSYDVFLTKYDTGGTLLWTEQFGTSSSESGFGVAVDATGNAFLTGITTGDLGGANPGGFSAFLAKFSASSSEPLPGDANLDGVVDLLDLGIVGDNWKQTGVEWGDGDFNDDDVVDLLDLGIVGDHWKEVAAGMSFGGAMSTVGVPEPSTFAMLIAATLGLAVFFVRRRQQQEKVTMKKCLMVLVCIAALAPCAANAEIIGTWSLEESVGGGLDRYVLTVTPTAGEVMTGFDIVAYDTDFTPHFATGGGAIFEDGKNSDTSFLLHKEHYEGSPPAIADLLVVSDSEANFLLQAAFTVATGGDYESGWSGALELLEILVSEDSITDPYSELTVEDASWAGPGLARVGFGEGAYFEEINMGGVIPEPGTLALLATGLTGLLCYAWRRRK